MRLGHAAVIVCSLTALAPIGANAEDVNLLQLLRLELLRDVGERSGLQFTIERHVDYEEHDSLLGPPAVAGGLHSIGWQI